MAASDQVLERAQLSFTAPTPGAVTVHPESGIVSTCLFGTLNGDWKTGRIEGLEFDTLLLTRGNNRPAHGMLGGEPFTVEPHSTLLITYIPQGVKAELTYFAEANTSSLLMFPPGRLPELMSGDSQAATMPFAMVDSERLVELFQMIETEILAPDSDHPGQIDTLTRMLAHYLVDRSAGRRAGQGLHMDISPHKLKRVLDYIDDHLGEAIDLKAMAEVAGLSRFHFVRVFKCTTGCSPYQHLIRRRVVRAQTLIAHGELRLADIGRISGFPRPSHFSAFFKRETGLSPTRYRQLVQRGVATPFDPPPY